MINFILVEDNNNFLVKTENILEKIMMKNQYDYKIHSFNEYNSKFMECMNKKYTNKIYILDIVTPQNSGIDIARKIRKNDVDSIIIFMTAHDELSSTVAKKILLSLITLNKHDDFEKNLTEAIKTSISIVGKKRIIKIQDSSTLYMIQLKDIVYITTDSVDRKLIIKTDCREYKVNKTIKEIKELTKDTLTQTHRSCLVNESKITKIDRKNSRIHFENGDSIDLLSTSYKKELV